jgi:hypothetical protein
MNCWLPAAVDRINLSLSDNLKNDTQPHIVWHMISELVKTVYGRLLFTPRPAYVTEYSLTSRRVLGYAGSLFVANQCLHAVTFQSDRVIVVISDGKSRLVVLSREDPLAARKGYE